MGMILKAESIGFSYPGLDQAIFRDVSLDISEGEIICVLGPNGVGKSTLLRCLAGLAQVTAGEIELGGRRIGSLPRHAVARELALVPQSHETVFAFSVRAVVEMGRAPHLGLFEMPGERDKGSVLKALDRLRIGHLAGASYAEISGGERQLVQIARVLVQEPRLMILDEPTAHLDFANQARLLRLVRDLAQSGLAIIFTTHSPDQAFDLAHRTLLLSHKHPATLGPTSQLLSEAALSTTYGVPVKLVRLGDHVCCFVALHDGISDSPEAFDAARQIPAEEA